MNNIALPTTVPERGNKSHTSLVRQTEDCQWCDGVWLIRRPTAAQHMPAVVMCVPWKMGGVLSGIKLLHGNARRFPGETFWAV